MFSGNKDGILKLGVLVHPCDPGTQEAEAGRPQGHPGPYSENLSQEKKKKKRKSRIKSNFEPF
jgi:hypothetical protein